MGVSRESGLGFDQRGEQLATHQVLADPGLIAATNHPVLVAVLEVVIFVWIFKPENAWKSIHMGADIQIPKIFKFIMTYVTPIYLLIILTWWGKDEAIPILLNQRSAGSSNPVSDIDMPFITISRGILVLMIVCFLFAIRMAWKRNGYDDRKGFVEIDSNRAEV